MRVVTRHLTKEILIATAFVLFALVMLFAFFDLVGQLKRIGRDYTLLEALGFTALELPMRVYEVMPIGALMGAVYTLSRWASTSEFTILRVSGMSPMRLGAMLCVPALILTVLTYAIGEYIAPQASKYYLESRSAALDRTLSARGYQSGVWVKDVERDGQGRIVSTRFVNVSHLEAKHTDRTGSWRVFEFDGNNHLKRQVHASKAQYVDGEGWALAKATVEDLPQIDDQDSVQPGQIFVERSKHWVMPTALTPSILGVMTVKPESMGMGELNQYIDHLKESSQTTENYEVALWSKMFYPLAIFVMFAVAMPFAYLNARSGGVSIKIFIGLMIGITFYTMNNVFQFVGVLNNLSPVLVSLAPSLVMLALASVALWFVEKR